LPVEAPPPARIWRPGDSYGPVASGEGLWGIALKVRPDPGISREHMMEALFEANPQAFSKAGASGLKIGAMLRIPTWREIADFTGSPVARRLAEAEQPTTSEGVDHARSAAAPVPAEPAKVTAGEPQVFPLEYLVVAEPVVVAASPAPPPEVVEPELESKAAPEPAVAAPEPAVAAATEPAPAAPEPEVYELALESTTVGQESSPQILEPVSVTPLLFLAVSEMMATITQIPTTAISEEVVSSVPAVDLIPLKPIGQIAALTESPGVVPSELGSPVPVVEPTEPPATPPAEPAPEPPPEPPATVAAEPLVVGSPEPTEPAVYKGGDRYGPVSNNERLWDIAAKVSPDPAISKDLMMKALFAVNPQAFSKAKMDSLKIGVMLRVPTLQEIVEHTGSKVAKQLLQQQQDSPTRLVEPEPKPVSESALPVAPMSAEPTETSQPGVAGPAAKPAPVVEAQPDSAAAPADAEPAELAEPASTDAAPAPIESPLPAPIGETAVSE
jgi:FimV-like protein